ncbi:hypothetical protein [Flaviaesturariibacter amylovorans]|uniref:DUF4369 domain-containing protein n=1 Tax=Flaviaesturariibacter amylovorans TaxID=1084520 RepID=A0ABP8HDV6_9BACT
MRYLFVLAFLLCGRAYLGAQEVNGLYIGTLYNDTTRLLQHFELSLSQESGRIRGFAYTTFTVNDRFYYGIRKVKGLVREGKLFVEDDELLDNNFPEKPAKGVRKLLVLPVSGDGLVEILEGRWETNRTKQWAPVTGTVNLRRKKDSVGSALVARLNELRPGPAPQARPLPRREEPRTRVAPAAPVVLAFEARKSTALQTVAVRGDSLTIALYDNGVVDGDSVSIYLNGQAVLTHIKLSDTATRHTLRLPAGDRVELALLAENLGTLAPNTGLLQIIDGDRRHNIYFSADLQTNAKLVLQKQR